jgi:hypothetical protein
MTADAARARVVHIQADVPQVLIPLTPTTCARLELLMLDAGTYRLTVEHPATRFVEYFSTERDALARWRNLQATLGGPLYRDDLTPAA